MQFFVDGHAGTGKTTHVVKDIYPKLREKYTNKEIVVLSFSNAAVAAVKEKIADIPNDALGTIDAFALRLTNMKTHFVHEKEFFDTKEKRKEKNEWEYKRQNMIPIVFDKHYDEYKLFKQRKKYHDFSDVLEEAIKKNIPLTTTLYAQDKEQVQVKALIIDEIQDINPLHAQLLLQWIRQCEEVYFSGDYAQQLYRFSGVSQWFEQNVKSSEHILLNSNHRFGSGIGNMVERFFPQYKQQYDNEDGVFYPHVLHFWKCKDMNLEDNSTVFFLARTNSEVAKIIDNLRDKYIVNTFESNDKGKVVDKLVKIYEVMTKGGEYPVLTYEEVVLADRLFPELWNRKTVRNVKKLKEEGMILLEGETFGKYLNMLFFSANFDTKAKALRASKMPYEDKQAILMKDLQKVKIFVGTYHQVKGLQADVVFASLNWHTMPWQANEEEPVLYVGMTRARKKMFFFKDSTLRYEICDFLQKGGISY